MKKYFACVVLILVLLNGIVVSATPVEELTNLSQYFPEEVPIFAVLQVDDGFIETLDGILGQIAMNVPEAIPPEASITLLLDEIARDAVGESFEDGIRSWLGDQVAIGILSTDALIDSMMEPQILIAVAITDKDGAIGFLQDSDLISEGSVMAEEGAFTTYAPDPEFPFGPYVAINDDVLLLATQANDMMAEMGSLQAAETFTNVVEGLPASDYNALVYMDVGAVSSAGFEMAQMQGDLPPMNIDFLQTDGAIAIGFTILDGDSFTLDMATTASNNAMLEQFGLESFVPGATNPDFAQNIPADAPLVIQMTDIGPNLLNTFDALRALDDFLAAGGAEDLFGDMLPSDVAQVLRIIPVSSLGTLTNISFAGLTGLNLEREVLPWMDGDATMFLRLVEDEMFPLFPDFAVAVGSSDADGANTLFNNLADSLDAFGFETIVESNDGVETLRLPWLRTLLSPNSPVENPNLDLVFSTNGELFTFGTNQATASFYDDSESIAGTADFTAAQAYFLNDTQQVWYISAKPLVGAIDTLLESDMLDMLSRSEMNDFYAMRTVLSLVESGSLTVVTNENGQGSIRLVLTLEDDPIPAPDIELEPDMMPTLVLPTQIPMATPTATPSS